MAQRRMFSLKIIDTDAFLDMPSSTQALYFHLAMRADDDGFVSNPKKILRATNCNSDDMKVLLTKRFILPFDSGVCVIKHWKIHNYIQSDRYSETTYLDEKKQLVTKKNKSYSLDSDKCIQNESRMETQVRLGKDSIVYTADYKIVDDLIQARFDLLWGVYPKKLGRKGAFSSYRGAISNGAKHEDIEKALNNYVQSIKDAKTEDKYIKHGSTFFNNWEDYLTYASSRPKSRADLNPVRSQQNSNTNS